MSTDRLAKLQGMLQRQPADVFLLYATAMEYKKLNLTAEAVEHLQRVVGIDPAYSAAYHQAGLIYQTTGDLEAARRWFRDGIAAATKAGDAHAAGEMQGALEEIGI
jgi:Tfp pilus assembly protein PilF